MGGCSGALTPKLPWGFTIGRRVLVQRAMRPLQDDRESVVKYDRANTMTDSRLQTRVLWLTEGALFIVAVGVAAWTSRATDWHPVSLAVLLLALALIGERLMVFVRGQQLSASFVALVLAMSLLGPAPAVLIGVAAKSLRSATGRLSP